MKFCLVTDAWLPQVNGVVTTMRNTVDHLRERGVEVLTITPDQFHSIPCPGYAEIRLALRPYRKVARLIEQGQPDVIHIATEGPLGRAARKYCLKHGLPFATSSHTRFPEYVRMRAPIPLSFTYGLMRDFHRPAQITLVRTQTVLNELAEKGFEHLAVWPGAVDTSLFYPRGKDGLDLPRPISVFVGRIAVEKGLPDFLDLDLPGSKVLIGGGPDLEKLAAAYPDAHFLGPKFGEELATLLSAADVFVFPSRTDTFGLVMLEAMACGVPVAAFPVPGPQDVIRQHATGVMDEDLGKAFYKALELDGDACIEFAQDHSWQRSTERLLSFQVPIDWGGDGDRRLPATPGEDQGAVFSDSTVLEDASPEAPSAGERAASL
ncbi:MAG: glycosyltransferase family 1 protein [Pseudomonadota bacterium]